MLSRFSKLNKLITIYIQSLGTHAHRLTQTMVNNCILKRISIWIWNRSTWNSTQRLHITNENLDNGISLFFHIQSITFANGVRPPRTEMKIAINVETDNTIFGEEILKFLARKTINIKPHWMGLSSVCFHFMVHVQKEKREKTKRS